MASTFARMRQAAADEADRIAGTQAALVAAGELKAPDADQTWRQDAFEALVKLVDRVMADEEIRRKVTGAK